MGKFKFMPKISVVIPTYNRAVYLDAAIASVLAQCGADFEIIVSDNCSQDDTTAVVSKYLADNRVHYYRNEKNIGMVCNWRKAVFEYATSDWFVLLSDDDYLIDPGYLAKVSRLIGDNPSLTMVYAEGYILDESTGEQKVLALPFDGVVNGVDVFLTRGTIKPQDFTLCNIVFNRKKSIALNAFSNPDNLSCDSELFLKLSLNGSIGVIKGPVSVYRFHPGNLIKTIYNSPELICGNMDFLINSYVFAKDRITREQLAVFRKNARIDRYVGNSLVRLANFSWEKYLSCRQDIARKAPELIKTIASSPRFHFKLFFARFGGRGFSAILVLRLKLKMFFR